MKDTQQQSLSNSIYDYLPILGQSVWRKEDFTSSISTAISVTFNKIGEIKTNLIYNIKHSDITLLPTVQRKEIEIRKDGPSALLLGHQYCFANSHNFLFAYRNTFWLTYRQGIKQIESDNGWGCMIRTVQMVFAETLKRNLKIKNQPIDQYKVIRHFSEQSDGVLSLSQICHEGDINKRWTSSLQVFSIFKNIMQANPQHFGFSVEIYSSGVMFRDPKTQLFQKYPALISLSNRVSLSEIPFELRPHYFAMMEHPTWVGSIGGVKGQALYIIGSYEDKVIFLDPHYVQSNEEELEAQTYFNRTPRGIDISNLSPSLSFCYYFEDKEAHLAWIEWISNTSESYYPNLIFQYIDQRVKQRFNTSKREEQVFTIMQAQNDQTNQAKVKASCKDNNAITIEIDEDSSEFQIL